MTVDEVEDMTSTGIPGSQLDTPAQTMEDTAQEASATFDPRSFVITLDPTLIPVSPHDTTSTIPTFVSTLSDACGKECPRIWRDGGYAGRHESACESRQATSTQGTRKVIHNRLVTIISRTKKPAAFAWASSPTARIRQVPTIVRDTKGEFIMPRLAKMLPSWLPRDPPIPLVPACLPVLSDARHPCSHTSPVTATLIRGPSQTGPWNPSSLSLPFFPRQQIGRSVSFPYVTTFPRQLSSTRRTNNKPRRQGERRKLRHSFCSQLRHDQGHARLSSKGLSSAGRRHAKTQRARNVHVSSKSSQQRSSILPPRWDFFWHPSW